MTASIQNKIKKVRKVYGGEDWDKRVKFLADQFLLKNFDPNNSAHSDCISAYAYFLSESDLSCNCTQVEKANVLAEASASVLAKLEICLQSSQLEEAKVLYEELGKVKTLLLAKPVVKTKTKALIKAWEKWLLAWTKLGPMCGAIESGKTISRSMVSYRNIGKRFERKSKEPRFLPTIKINGFIGQCKKNKCTGIDNFRDIS